MFMCVCVCCVYLCMCTGLLHVSDLRNSAANETDSHVGHAFSVCAFAMLYYILIYMHSFVQPNVNVIIKAGRSLDVVHRANIICVNRYNLSARASIVTDSTM